MTGTEERWEMPREVDGRMGKRCRIWRVEGEVGSRIKMLVGRTRFGGEVEGQGVREGR